VRHGLTHGLVDGFLQGWPQISGQLLQDIIRPELSGFVKEALMKHRRFTRKGLWFEVRAVMEQQTNTRKVKLAAPSSASVA